ncbi:unnamed protein product [Toxocara canis]|uniref:Uncharacterized protein n=1 Tax=Toxocara canis TaxID=6265 RepID=A0A183V074_TOXCA|nr:unnamed protein product [Toxocara canis]
MPLTHKTLRSETEKDEILQAVISHTSSSWPDIKQLPKLPTWLELVLYHRNRNVLTVAQGCLMFADRVTVPRTLCPKVQMADGTIRDFTSISCANAIHSKDNKTTVSISESCCYTRNTEYRDSGRDSLDNTCQSTSSADSATTFRASGNVENRPAATPTVDAPKRYSSHARSDPS